MNSGQRSIIVYQLLRLKPCHHSYNLEHHAHLDGDSSVIEYYKVIGGGHTWFHFELNGKSTNWLLWEFFDQFDIYGKR